MNILDKAIGFFDPQAALGRARARTRLKRAYSGATKGRRGDNWRDSNLSANAEISMALPILQSRSRELVRNNAYAARAMQVIQANVVGKGIRPAIVHKNSAVEAKVRKAWQEWGETVQCDMDDTANVYGLQSLAMRAQAESGEVFIRKRFVKDGENLVLKLQMLESDFLVTEQNSAVVQGKQNKGNKIVQGIEYSKKGKIIAYHFFKEHPANLGLGINWDYNIATVRVPAEEVIHLYKADRPKQNRGTPWLTPVMQRLKDFDDYEQAQLMRQKISACFMAFVTDPDGDLDSEQQKKILSKLEPATIEILPAGRHIELADPPQVNENYADYTRVMLQAVATGVGISYEAMTGNLKDINFSSSRMGWLEFQRNIDQWRSNANTQMNSKIMGWFLEWQFLLGVDTTEIEHTWTSPRREMIDPAKEVPSLIAAVGAGFKSVSEVVRESGKNPEEHFAEIKAEREMFDKMGLTFQTGKTPEDLIGKKPVAVNKKSDTVSKSNPK